MIIELLDGTRFDLADFDLKRLFHYIPSANIDHTTSPVEGRPDIITHSSFNNRVIRVEFLYLAQDIHDYDLLRDELNALFMRTEPYYISFKREPHKRWLVKVASQYEIPPNPKMESFTVNFMTVNGVAESVATTQTLKEWDVDSWAWDGTIDWDEELQYTFLTNNFTVKNLGNVAIDPCKHDLEIVIKATASSFLQLRNVTTGDIYRFNGVLASTDTLVIKGVRTLKNGISAFKHTNKKLISLNTGDNQFVVEGGTIHHIAFNFRFLYM